MDKKIKLGYIFRLDDITPGMNWKNFAVLEDLFDKYNIKPIIGVVPDNKDTKLEGYGHIGDFWGKIRSLQKKGWTIAQHGYQHLYTTNNAGIIGMNTYSEFAGLSYSMQYEKIAAGKSILEKELGAPIVRWMAPAHSFDKNTCKALKTLGFTHITDGIALYPFERYGLKRLPQQIWRPQDKRSGVRTICLHINHYDSAFLEMIKEFTSKNYKECIDANCEMSYATSVSSKILTICYKLIFWTGIFLYKVKKKIVC